MYLAVSAFLAARRRGEVKPRVLRLRRMVRRLMASEWGGRYCVL
jgi:hypothetical protein